VKTVKPFRLSTLTRPYRWQRRDHLGVAVMALSSLGDDPRLMPEQALWKTAADEIGPGAVLDLGTPKLVPEFLASGYGYTNHQADKTVCAVRLRVGGIEKTLTVFGDRFWLNGRPTPAQPFERMPLDWSHAYGGAGVPENPLGMGSVDEIVNGVRTRRLPHIEAPGAHVSSPRQAPAPVSLGAIPPEWPQRMSLGGTKYDQEWLENDFPGFARDIDWRYFNAAPADQRWEGRQELPAGAPYEIWNMHPDVPILRGNLPNWQPRCFISPRKDGGELRETALRLTTAWFFPHRERVALIWHGMFPIVEDDAADVQIIMAALELPDAPRPLSHYEEVMRRRLDPERGAIHAVRDSDLVPREVMGEWDSTLMPDVLADPMARNMRAGHLRDYEARRAELLAQGEEPDKYLSPPPPLEKPPAIDDLPEFLERMEAEAQKAKEEMGLLAAWDASTDATRFDAGPAARDPKAEGETADNPLPGEAEAPAVDEGTQRMAALVHQSQLHTAHFSAPAPAMPSFRSAKWRRRLAALEPGRRNFSGLNLTGVDLSEMDLQGADFSGAILEDANLGGANLDGCDFSQAVLARAQLTRTSMARAMLRQANLGGARCDHAVLTGAMLHETNCHKTQFESCNLVGASFDQTHFNEAVLKGCNLGKSRWRQVSLIKMSLEDLVFDEADFDQMTWIECRLQRVSFVAARLLRCGFVTTDCSDAVDFSGATLEGSSFAHGSSLVHAMFRNALVKQCGLRTTPLAHADLSDARLDNSDFSECDMSHAKLERIAAGDSLFIRTNFTGASFRDANLIDANLSKSDLRSADLGGANLYRADVSQAQIDALTRMQGAYTQNAKVWPARRPEAPAA
jgi:uncharacterized protein YjbI with pentapeptide repeats